MPNKIPYSELKNKVFSRLTVIGDLGHIKQRRMLLVRCACGVEKIVFMGHLVGGKIVSCGCNKREKTITRNFKHGFRQHPLNRVWRAMKERCYNPHSISYPYYGGKGVEICGEWLDNPSLFYKWAFKNGYKPGLIIDRIKNELGYSPSNCRWISRLESARNMTTNHNITFGGETKCLTAWCDQLNIPKHIVSDRINKLGWSFEKAISIPVRKLKKYAA